MKKTPTTDKFVAYVHRIAEKAGGNAILHKGWEWCAVGDFTASEYGTRYECHEVARKIMKESPSLYCLLDTGGRRFMSGNNGKGSTESCFSKPLDISTYGKLSKVLKKGVDEATHLHAYENLLV
jgi:hypothetical protein